MQIQNNKCAFCEKKFERIESGGKRDADIEHFRPKSSIKEWPTEEIIEDFDLPGDFPRSEGCEKGYHLLAYHLLNYSVACKPCNQQFKKDYFPINGSRKLNADDPVKLKTEKPYLVFPIGDLDDDPETILRYDGVHAVPVERNGFKYDRARVTILFFKLNDREELFERRAEKILLFFHSLENIKRANTREQLNKAEKIVANLLSGKKSYTNCCRSFKKIYDSDRERALKIINKIGDYHASDP